jgi:hypothetical protein
LDVIASLIRDFDPAKPHFHATEIYNESWLVKAVLNQSSNLKGVDFPLSFMDKSTWFSEAYLPTAFAPRQRGDKLGEARTHADGVIGHFTIGDKGRADLHLDPRASQFTVVEAKMSSPLSSGTSNAPGYDQAARNVACMAETLQRAKLPAAKLDRISFVVIAPAEKIREGTFASLMTIESIREKVRQRVAAYGGTLDQWKQDWFDPLADVIELHSLSWEDALVYIGDFDREAAQRLLAFYEQCLLFN